MSTDTIKRCPFCGGQIFVRPYIYKNEPSIKSKYAARCENPKCTCYVQSKIYNTIDEAIAAWNTRKPMERVLKRLEEEERLSEEAKVYAASNNPLQYERCDSYLSAIGNAIEIVKEEGGIE